MLRKLISYRSLILLISLTMTELPAKALSDPSDYFRSAGTGDWSNPATWESSPDNATWSAATLVPDNTANAIYIRNTHTVTVSINQSMDQVIIENGGILLHTTGILTITDEPSVDDVIVQAGGIFTLSSNNNPPQFAVSSATANIYTGGMLRVSAVGLTFAGTGVNASNYIYQDAAVLEYTLATPFSSANVTYFPNVNASTIPIFRTTNNVGIVGAGTNTVINGLFEANGNVTFQNPGTKTFRNGITGTGNINGSGSGKFIINGTTAKFGGTGMLIVSAANGLEIGGSTTVTMVSTKVMTGTINLLSPTALILLGNFNLDITAGNVTGGSATAHVVTNGSGKLIFNFITGTPQVFPIGADQTTINTLVITNGGGFSYGARVETGINPNIAVPLSAVNRTWFVTPTGGTPATINTDFYYYAGDGNAGFNYAANVELGQYTGVWNVIQTGLVPAGAYQVATTISTLANNTEAPLVLANLGAILATGHNIAVDYFDGLKQNGNHQLHWKLSCQATAFIHIQLERSTDARNYSVIYNEHATALRCEQPFSFTDNLPAAGINYYRLKITDDAGKVFYSSMVSLINVNKGINIMKMSPNPVVGNFINVKISAAEKMKMEFVITDMQGRILQKQTVALIAGFNNIPVNTRNLAAGTYQLFGNSPDGRTGTLRFVKP